MRFICKKDEDEKITPLLITQAVMDCVIEEGAETPIFIRQVARHLIVIAEGWEEAE